MCLRPERRRRPAIDELLQLVRPLGGDPAGHLLAGQQEHRSCPEIRVQIRRATHGHTTAKMTLQLLQDHLIADGILHILEGRDDENPAHVIFLEQGVLSGDSQYGPAGERVDMQCRNDFQAEAYNAFELGHDGHILGWSQAITTSPPSPVTSCRTIHKAYVKPSCFQQDRTFNQALPLYVPNLPPRSQAPIAMKIVKILIFIATAITFVFLLLILGVSECSDGFISHSIGKRGACSHHGGVSFFSKIKFPLILFITWLVWNFLTSLTKKKKNYGHNNNTSHDSANNNDIETNFTTSSLETLDPIKLHSNKKPKSIEPSKLCPKCRSKLVLRVAKRGRNPGGKFWGCSRYPKCRGTREYLEEKNQEDQQDQ